MNNDKTPGHHGKDSRESVQIVCHGPSALGLQLGLGPQLRPTGSIQQLQGLLNSNAFWCKGRTLGDLRRMVRNSAVCVTAWRGQKLIGFGRATSDAIFRGTIWDVVVDSQEIGQGIGRAIVEKLLLSRQLATCERIYLMTTNSAEFYKKLGFDQITSQILMIKQKSG